MRAIVRNASMGATISTVLAAILLLFVSHQARDAMMIKPLAIHLAALEQLATDVLYIWCAATLGAIIYGALAVRLGIYGQGSHALHKWKNGLLGLLITIAIAAVVPAERIGASTETTAPLFVAMLLATAISDAHAPSGASTVGG